MSDSDENSDELRKRAAWYREFAERAGNPWIWAARLKTADELEAEAARVESKPTWKQERDEHPPLHLVWPAKRPGAVPGRISRIGLNLR